MSTSPLHSQKPADTSPYASIRSTQPSTAPELSTTPTTSADTLSPGFTVELAKLQEMRDALWDAFKAGPNAGFPNFLIDITNSYTNSLRVQLNMRSLNARKNSTPVQPLPAAKATNKG